MITDRSVGYLSVVRTGTTHTFRLAESISIGYDILFREVEHINRVDGDSQEAGFKVEMRTGRTSGVTTQTDHFAGFYQLIFFNELFGQVSVYGFQSIVMTNHYIFTISSAFILHDTYFTVKGSYNRVTDVHLQVQTIVHSSPAGTERRSNLRTRSRHTEACEVDGISVGDDSIAVSMCILVVPVWIKT